MELSQSNIDPNEEERLSGCAGGASTSTRWRLALLLRSLYPGCVLLLLLPFDDDDDNNDEET